MLLYTSIDMPQGFLSYQILNKGFMGTYHSLGDQLECSTDHYPHLNQIYKGSGMKVWCYLMKTQILCDIPNHTVNNGKKIHIHTKFEVSIFKTEMRCENLSNYQIWHIFHDDVPDVLKWKHFLCYWPFVWRIHRSPVNSTHKGQWCGALMFSLICAWTNGWVNNHEAGDLRCHRAQLWRDCNVWSWWWDLDLCLIKSCDTI